MKQLFSDERIETVQRDSPAASTAKLVNYFAEAAITRLSNGLYDRLEAGSGPRYLRRGASVGCRCGRCTSWQIVELDATGGKNVIDETEDLMDWLDE